MSKPLTTKTCSWCNQTSEVEVSDDDYVRIQQWVAGEGPRHIQDVVPTWSDDQRELFISGTHPKCWDAMFADGVEDD